MKERPNLVELPNGAYLVRTQAGFRKMLKEVRIKCDAEGYKHDGHPIAYPSVVQFQVVDWCCTIWCYPTPLNEYTEQTLKLLQILQEN